MPAMQNAMVGSGADVCAKSEGKAKMKKLTYELRRIVVTNFKAGWSMAKVAQMEAINVQVVEDIIRDWLRQNHDESYNARRLNRLE